jgi:hypothetical protein
MPQMLYVSLARTCLWNKAPHIVGNEFIFELTSTPFILDGRAFVTTFFWCLFATFWSLL